MWTELKVEKIHAVWLENPMRDHSVDLGIRKRYFEVNIRERGYTVVT
jgi:hypothetical protein